MNTIINLGIRIIGFYTLPKKRKRKKEKNPNSPFAKLSHMLFGTPEELDPEAAAEFAAANPQNNIDPKEAKEKKKQEKELKKQKKKEEIKIFQSAKCRTIIK